MPPCPAGRAACPGCKHVFLREGQRFCGLCMWRTPAGANYQRILAQRIRDLMSQAVQIRNQMNPIPEQLIPPIVAPVDVQVHVQAVPAVPVPDPLGENVVFDDLAIEDMILAE